MMTDGQATLQSVSNDLNRRLERDGYLTLRLDELKEMLGIKPNPGDEMFGYMWN